MTRPDHISEFRLSTSATPQKWTLNEKQGIVETDLPSRPAIGKNAPPKKPTNVTLSADLVVEAKRLGLNISQICEENLYREVRKALGEEWKRENREAIEWSNEYVRKNGLPLEKYRMF